MALGGLITLLVALVIAVTPLACASRQPAPSTRLASAWLADFDVLLPTASPWKGTLTYLDYAASKPVTIPSTFKLTKADNGWLFAIGYDEAPHANSDISFKLLDGGANVASGDTREQVQSRRTVGDRIEITTISSGTDDNKPASIRKVHSISPATFSLQTLVKFADGGGWFERHAYHWTR